LNDTYGIYFNRRVGRIKDGCLAGRFIDGCIPIQLGVPDNLGWRVQSVTDGDGSIPIQLGVPDNLGWRVQSVTGGDEQ